jgi:type IV pilus assembly protein PilV
MKQHARGFSMIELLVAVLVMGIGVLGISGLQLVSLQNNRGALFRGEAVQLAYDVMDRIRANPGANYNGVAFGAAPAAPTNCNANNCSEADMAVFDRAVWKCSLGNFNTDATCIALRAAGVLPAVTDQPGLPNGDGAVAVDGATQIVTVSVRWQEPNATQLTTITIQSQG